MSNTALLHTPEGVRDIYGEEMKRKKILEDRLSSFISKYGYQSIATPTFEFFEVFSKEIGTTPSRELYKFFDKEGNTLVLRPDFTPSIARCAAKYYMDEDLVVRFMYHGNTFTNTSNLQGKLKEVTEMGAELIGDDSVYADAEMIALVIEALKNAGLKDFQITIGQAEYFRGLCEAAGFQEDIQLSLRELFSVKNWFGVESFLENCAVTKSCKEAILKMTDYCGGMDMLTLAKENANNPRSVAAIERLIALYDVLKLYQVEKYITFDLGMLSKYNYYTGIIFKAYTYGVGDAIIKGGRYDSLLSKFGKNAPAIGFVVVIDDLMEAFKSQKIELPLPKNPKEIYYNSGNFAKKLKECNELRQNGECVSLIPEGGQKK